jgi:hypothetical protein
MALATQAAAVDGLAMLSVKATAFLPMAAATSVATLGSAPSPPI